MKGKIPKKAIGSTTLATQRKKIWVFGSGTSASPSSSVGVLIAVVSSSSRIAEFAVKGIGVGEISRKSGVDSEGWRERDRDIVSVFFADVSGSSDDDLIHVHHLEKDCELVGLYELNGLIEKKVIKP